MPPQIGIFPGCKLKHEIFGKSVDVAPDSAIKRLRLHPIEPGQIYVQHDFLATNQNDGVCNAFERDNRASPFFLAMSIPFKFVQGTSRIKVTRKLSRHNLFQTRRWFSPTGAAMTAPVSYVSLR